MFPVTKLEIPLDRPENTRFKMGDSVQLSLTSVNNQTNAAVLEKIENLPKAHSHPKGGPGKRYAHHEYGYYGLYHHHPG